MFTYRRAIYIAGSVNKYDLLHQPLSPSFFEKFSAGLITIVKIDGALCG
ncbi:hypothetical protein QFZ51_004006 [Chitinophaga sp. W3I9]